MICDECDQVLRAHAHDIDDAHVREQSRGGPLVDSRAANAEQWPIPRRSTAVTSRSRARIDPSGFGNTKSDGESRIAASR